MTVSYTCQKPIKFWAKCKINLLYKLNQSLLCVPGCPLLLATRPRTWASFLLPLIWCCSLWIHSLPNLPSCLISHHLACSSHSPAPCYLSVHPICFTNTRKTALPTTPLLLCLTPRAADGKHLCSSSVSPGIFLDWLQISALSLSYPSVATSYITFLHLSFWVNKMEIIRALISENLREKWT